VGWPFPRATTLHLLLCLALSVPSFRLPLSHGCASRRVAAIFHFAPKRSDAHPPPRIGSLPSRDRQIITRDAHNKSWFRGHHSHVSAHLCLTLRPALDAAVGTQSLRSVAHPGDMITIRRHEPPQGVHLDAGGLRPGSKLVASLRHLSHCSYPSTRRSECGWLGEWPRPITVSHCFGHTLPCSFLVRPWHYFSVRRIEGEVQIVPCKEN